MAISGAAWEEINMALLVRGESTGWLASAAAISASAWAMIAARVAATRSWSCARVSPCRGGITNGL
jgi:hypothetical protein